MNLYEQNVAIAEACGVKPLIEEYVVEKDHSIVLSALTRKQCQEWLDCLPEDSHYKNWSIRPWLKYPDYSGSLDAMHEAEQSLTSEELMGYNDLLRNYLTEGNRTCSFGSYAGDFIWHAKATVRARAFLIAKGKWYGAATATQSDRDAVLAATGRSTEPAAAAGQRHVSEVFESINKGAQ